MQEYLKNHSLSVVLLALWVVSSVLHFVFQVVVDGETLSTFLASTFENWQSEFLQLLTMVLLTKSLIEIGSKESKQPGEK